MWKLVFEEATDICTATNREPVAGEYKKDVPSALCGFVNNTPRRYKWDTITSTLIERPEWPSEEAAEQMVLQKKAQIDNVVAAFYITAAADVVVDGVHYKGGQESADTINGAVELAKQLNETTVTVFDVNDDEHDLSIADGKKVAAQVGKAFRTAYHDMRRAVRTIKHS